ncbi:MAG: sarcosine oxidase subunit delta [Actinobacteria bacterium]|nr:sarcosine oxidase subunit delta [Actinomycetota bacterium]
MILLPCPYCGPRNASEFRYIGEQGERPDPNQAAPSAWRSYLYVQSNEAGWVIETWWHASGCRRYLIVERETVTNEVRAVRPPAAPPRHRLLDQAEETQGQSS